MDAYAERLSVPLRWWALAVMFWATALVAFLIAMPVPAAVAVVGTLAGITFAFFVTWGGVEIAVEDGVLRAGRAHIPVTQLADAQPLDESATRRAIGVEADARAYLLLRPYVLGSVKVRVVDPEDPTPYWLVATRHPRALADQLNALAGRR